MKLLLQITLLIFITSCTNNNNQNTTKNNILKTEPIKKIKLEIDKNIEYNSPQNLDSTKHQLFIDTTRNSKYYNQITNWKPNKYDIEGVEYYFKEITKTFKPKKINLNGFPRNWISIQSLNNEFVAYNPLNGINWRFELTDSSINHYKIESDTEVISRLISIQPNKLILEIRSYFEGNQNQTSFFKIQATTTPFLYTLQHSTTLSFKNVRHTFLITPIEHLKEFNLVVDDAPTLVRSYVRFDKVVGYENLK
jgi:hypothetical protein